jgi:predicted RNase H-like HicB family nuclease
MKGSHRQLEDPVEPGKVTVAGAPGVDLPKKTLNSILKQAGLTKRSVMKYAVIIEKGPTSFGAYVPDLPGCIAAAETRDEVERLIREAIEEHIALLRGSGDPAPEPTVQVTYVEMPAV